MYEEIKSIDFIGEMKTDDLYHLYKTNSSQINLEILAKLQKCINSGEFFKHYINTDIKIFYENLDLFSLQLSSLLDENNHINFDSKIDQYISDFTYIFALLNILSKLNISLNSIILNIKQNLTNLYSKYEVDKNKQDSIDELIFDLLNNLHQKDNSQKFLSKCSTKDNSVLSIDKNLISNNENKENNENNENNEYNINQKILRGEEDFFLQDKQNSDRNNIMDTPKFNDIKNINPSFSNKKKINNNKINKEEPINNLNLVKKKSIDSVFTLSSNKKSEEKGKEKGNIINDNNNEETKKENLSKVNIQDYISNINQNDFIIKRPRPRRTSYIKNIKSKINGDKSIDRVNSLFSVYKENENTFKNPEKMASYKKLHVSSGHLFMKEESKRYAELFEIIIELYKNQQINLEEKLKLKKLIICKSPKILNIYKFYHHEDENFVIKLKEII